MRQGSAEQRRVVCIERNHESLVEIVFRGMLRGRLAHSGAKVAGDAEFNRNLPLSEFVDQIGVLRGRQAMANPLGAQVQCSPNGLRRSGLARMRRQPQSVIGGVCVNAAEKFRRSLYFVTANTDSDHMAIPEAR